jgi:hypothetical protein
MGMHINALVLISHLGRPSVTSITSNPLMGLHSFWVGRLSRLNQPLRHLGRAKTTFVN